MAAAVPIADGYAILALAALSIFVSVLWFYKAFYELGTDNVRGQFYAIMALAFLFQGVGFLFTRMGETLSLSFLGILAYILARFFFFVANARYIIYFQSLGYHLSRGRAVVVFLLTALFAVLTFFIPNVPEMFVSFAPDMLFILLDVGMVFIVIYNMFLLWGSEIAKKWAIGSVVIVSFLMGDAFFIAGANPWISIAFWTVASTLMGLIATIRG